MNKPPTKVEDTLGIATILDYKDYITLYIYKDKAALDNGPHNETTRKTHYIWVHNLGSTEFTDKMKDAKVKNFPLLDKMDELKTQI